MSGYFIHGGTQYPFGQGGNSNQSQSRQQSNSNSSNVSSNYYGNNSTWQQGSQSSSEYPTSYPTSNSNSNKLDYSSNYGSQSYGSSNNNGGGGSYGSSRSGSNNAGTIGTTSRNSGYGNSSVSSSNYDGNNYSSSYSTGGSNGNSGTTGTSAGGSNYYSSNNKNYSYGGSGDASSYSSATNNFSASSSSSYQGYESAYEKVLYNAANQYFQNNRRGGIGTYNATGRGSYGASRGNKRGTGRGGIGRGGMGRGMGDQRKTVSTGPKPIKASEVKAYLYAWCGQRKLKPEYEVTPKGTQPKVTFACKLVISGLDYVAKVEASNKKDAQSKAAWDFCDNLVKMGYMKTTELPPKPTAPTPKSGNANTSEAVGSLPAESNEEVEKHGGWTLSNSRQRLNQFCQREHLSPDFKHQTLGPEHARVFICDLKISVKSLKREFIASERGSNKKQATAVCALSMVRQLFAESLIEKHGDPIKHVSRGSLIEGGKSSMLVPKGNVDEQNRKRKAEDQASEPIDEHGNWTLENSRQRLNQYCQVNQYPCEVIYSEEGQPGSRTYTASLNLKVKKDEEEQEINASSKGQSKKNAAQGCALQILTQLYKLTLVEANIVGASPITKKKNPNGRANKGLWNVNDAVNAAAMFSGRMPMRKTTVQDLYINEKHKQIYPTEKELDAVQKAVRVVELALKDVADELTEPAPASEVNDTAAADSEKAEPDANTEDGDVEMKETPKKRTLQSVVRVGTLAKGLLLKGDTNVELVLLCQEAPTQKLLVKVAQLLPKYLKTVAETDVVDVELAIQKAGLLVHYTTGTDTKMAVKVSVSLTSPVIRNPSKDDEPSVAGSTALLNKEKCLEALAEVRHAKWFQACANVIPSCIIVIRIIREMKQRVREWQVLNDWTLELVVEKALRTSPVPLSLGGSLQRVFECISSGMLLPGQNSVMDPCEREKADAAGNLSNQERENITAAAQNALRLFTFRQPHKVLGIDEIKNSKYSNSGGSNNKEASAEATPAAEEMQQ